MDAIDRVLLNKIQANFPITTHPYIDLGALVGIAEKEAYERISGFREEGLIRRLGGVFDSRKLGYCSTLCAAKVSEEDVLKAAQILEGIPGVTHNYLRNHPYNMWFTLIAKSKEDVENILNQVRETTGISEIYSLPAERLFKINVDFDFQNEIRTSIKLEQGDFESDTLQSIENEGYSLTNEDISLIKVLQNDLPQSVLPFKDIGASLKWDEVKVINKIKKMLQTGVIRRFGAVLRHQKAGFVANAMGVWIVSPERVEEVGQKMASFKEVSHCYQRRTLPDWPYNLFTMVHGQSEQECRNIIERISQETGINSYNLLFSVAELKKSSMQYFQE